MTEPLVLAVDQGTTNTKAVVVGPDGGVRASAAVRVGIHFPQPGWAESDAAEIWDSVRRVIATCMRNVPAGSIAAIGVSNQRESVVAWERSSGQAIGPVVSWQCGRGAPRCNELARAGHGELVRERTGLALDPMFAATKMAWMLDATVDGYTRAADGEICLGTVDSWLLWNLTEGRTFATDLTNASRTSLLDLERGEWAVELLEVFGVPRPALPAIHASIAPFGVARLAADAGPIEVPIWGVAGDSHAALVGHRALAPGAVKASFGTGTSVMAPVDLPTRAKELSATIAWSRVSESGVQTTYALEGNIYATGSALEWTAALLGFGDDVSRVEALARTCATTGGVSFVPALSGLGAPYWDTAARGLITGLTRGAGAAEVSRATFEAVAHQVTDVLDCMRRLGLDIDTVHADGGAIRSDLLASVVADLSGIPIVRCDEHEVAALGAALLAGVGAGVWPSLESTTALELPTTRFEPQLAEPARRDARRRWDEAIRRALTVGFG